MPEGPRIKLLCSEGHVAFAEPLTVAGHLSFQCWVKILSLPLFSAFLEKLLSALGLGVLICKMGQLHHNSILKDCSEHSMS